MLALLSAGCNVQFVARTMPTWQHQQHCRCGMPLKPGWHDQGLPLVLGTTRQGANPWEGG